MNQPIEEIAPIIAGALAGAAAEELGAGLAGRLIATTLAKTAADKMSAQSEDESEECECGENEECGCKKVVQNPADYMPAGNKYNTVMKERTHIAQLLKNLNEKNYAEAHKYLKKIMESKLQNRIASVKGVKLF
jgi:gas vesicle protein